MNTRAIENDFPMERNESERIGPPREIAEKLGRFSFYNVITSGALSIVLLFLLVVIINSRIGHATKTYKATVTLSAIFEVSFSISFIFTSPVFTAIRMPGFQGLLIVNCGSFFTFRISQIMLTISFFLLTQLISIPPILYYIRHAQVCRKAISAVELLFIFVFYVIFLCLSAGCFCYASLPTSSDIEYFTNTANQYTGHNNSFLLLSYTKSTDSSTQSIEQIASIISAISYFLSLVISIFIMGFCSYKMNQKILSTPNMSANLIKLQRKMNQILLSQFLCALICIQLPFFYSVLGPIFGTNQGLATDLLPFLFAWTPAVNTLTIFILNSEIRNALVRKQQVSGSSEVRKI